MPRRPLPEILQTLAELRERLPADRGEPLPQDSTWLASAARDDRLCWALAQARAILIELDQDARILFVSPNVEQITGFPPEALRGIYAGDRVHPDDLERLIDVSRAMGSGTAPDRPQLRARHRDGSWIHLEAVSAARFRARDGRIHSVSVLCDVTERQRAWAALRESEERYRVIALASRDTIIELDEERRHTFVSDTARDLLGFSHAELSAMPSLSLIHPDDQPRVEERLSRAFHSGTTLEIEPFRVKRQDGTWIWYECTGITYRRADGERRFLAVGRDVTERLRQEEERRALEARMEQAKRLEGLGVLAGGIAHDFNNLLTPILGETRLALGDLPASSPLRERLERILRAAQRAAELTQQMLANAGADRPRTEPIDLSPLVDEMSQLVEVPESAAVRFHYELVKGLPRVDGDAAQIAQVVTNVVTNAVEAIGAAPGRVTVRTGEIRLDEGTATHGPSWVEPLEPGHYVYLEVEDTGGGMDAHTLARIFDPFFTTKFTGRGLGLAAVLGIVRGHEGGIEIDSRVGRGTRFRVLFPTRAPHVRVAA